ncbi:MULTISPECIES: hypothetical protein [Sphingomonadales]|uniref:Uncharacterized protein n=1 Tax=Sphingobium agri TaxID=2933566 RepID=A0ABT0DSW6_9SPHN|nr:MULTISPECIES: hypothetical protein [Sphingomonadaceae]MCK0530207.1 hypothetical protein [Sphingobium agri]
MMMIAALLAASFVQPAIITAQHRVHGSAPCLASPQLCASGSSPSARLKGDAMAPGPDNKMSAYRFDARPCRIIGNMGCPKQARLRLFRLGEPLRDTLMRSFGPR